MKGFLRSVALLACGAVFFHVLAILLGAPVFASSKETFIFAGILTLCSCLPSTIVISSWSDFLRIHFDSEYLNNKERTTSVLAKSSIFGAWLGAFAIPLDWDRWWQEWPITCVVGCVFGFLLGFVYSRLFAFRRQVSKNISPLFDFKPKSV